MTKDYAKKRRISTSAKLRTRPHHASYSQEQEGQPAWIWMMTGLFVGLTLSAILYWKFHQPNKTRPTISLEMQDDTKTASSNLAAKESKSSRFDFYTMLPTTLVEGPEFTQEPSAAKTETLAQVASLPVSSPVVSNPVAKNPQETFVIQAGSFRMLSQAEALKAQLALSGIQASIQTVRIEGKDLRYRVNVGPFQNRDQALTKQKNIEQAHRLHSFVVKSHV